MLIQLKWNMTRRIRSSGVYKYGLYVAIDYIKLTISNIAKLKSDEMVQLSDALFTKAHWPLMCATQKG